jgi:hypothetical protein
MLLIDLYIILEIEISFFGSKVLKERYELPMKVRPRNKWPILIPCFGGSVG